jgi:hypothetical protein
MVTVLEAEAVEVGCALPLSFQLNRGEILALFLGAGASRPTLLRALAGRERLPRGAIRVTDPSRLVIVSPGLSHASAFHEQPDSTLCRLKRASAELLHATRSEALAVDARLQVQKVESDLAKMTTEYCERVNAAPLS